MVAGVPWLCAPCARLAGRPRHEVPAAGEVCSRCGDHPSVAIQILLELRALRALAAAPSPEAPAPAPVAVPVEEAERLLGCARTKVFELVRKHLLESVKPGKQRLITRRSIDRLLLGEGAGPARPPIPLKAAPRAAPRAGAGRGASAGRSAAQAIRALKLE